MNNAVWLTVALPTWYLEAALDPFGAGALTLIPAIGLLSLVVGFVSGAVKRRRGLLWFLLLFLSSQAFVTVAGAMQGQLRGYGSLLLLQLFVAAQVVASGYLIYRTEEARFPAVALGVFSVTYATAAAFVAAMSFNDSWL